MTKWEDLDRGIMNLRGQYGKMITGLNVLLKGMVRASEIDDDDEFDFVGRRFKIYFFPHQVGGKYRGRFSFIDISVDCEKNSVLSFEIDNDGAFELDSACNVADPESQERVLTQVKFHAFGS